MRLLAPRINLFDDRVRHDKHGYVATFLDNAGIHVQHLHGTLDIARGAIEDIRKCPIRYIICPLLAGVFCNVSVK